MENANLEFDDDKSFGLVGTARYIPPGKAIKILIIQEMVRGEDSTPHSAQDIWAVGVIVCQMATGKKPYCQYDNDWAVYYHIGRGGVPELPTQKEFSETGLDFLQCILIQAPNLRPAASRLLQHNWLSSG